MTDISDFMAAHDKLAEGVYLVEVFEREHFICHAIFSTSDKAKEWMHALPDKYNCLCAPFIIDHPDYGNQDKGKMQ